MRSRDNTIRQGFCAGLLGAAVWLAAPTQAVAQSCSTSGDTTSCTIAAGSYSSEISIFYTPPLGPLRVNAAGMMTVPASVDQNSALSFTNDGPWGTSSESQGANADGLTIGNTGSITLTQGQNNSINNYLFGLYSRMTGGQGYNGNPGQNQTLNGGSTTGGTEFGFPTQLTLSNSGAITIDLPNVEIWSGGALYALSQGGNGGSNGSGIGGAGGTSGGAAISNSGAITASLAGQFGFSGIEALGIGGSAGAGDNGTAGGGGGVSTVANSAPVTITWNWQNTGSINYGLYGILAQSKGGNGTGSNGNQNSQAGGEGGSAPSASVTLTQGGSVAVTEAGSPPAGGLGSGFAANVTGAGVAAEAIGGNGGYGEANNVSAGNGGNAAQGGVTLDVTDANVATSGASLPGLLALGQGGAGGLGATENDGSNAGSRESNGGLGGSAFAATADVTAQAQPVQITTAGAYSPAIVALLQGGAGGYANQHVATAEAGQTAGNGGRGGNVYGVDTITVAGAGGNAVRLTTTGSNSPGIDALSQGGAGGNGGEFIGNEGGAQGGAGAAAGDGGPVNVTLQSASISTQGQSAPGIVAQSQGAKGGTGGDASGLKSTAGAGGAGGSSGAVTVSLDSAAAITTQGAGSSGIQAQSLSGPGGDGGEAGALKASGGAGGGVAGAGNVTVTNAGVVSTAGANARGILAQSMSGVGGSGGLGSGSFYGAGGTGGSSGTVGTVTITNTGTISTSGADAEGILAQSIGGSGGAGGSGSGLFAGVGGSGATNPFTSNANDVVINNGAVGGSIITSGFSAIGILGQSIGGGGGDGGGASGAVSIGASGGGGGAGALASTNLIGATITTSGDAAHGLVMQSIGGGGGNAGNANGTGLFASVAIGGSGGVAGAGGTVVANASGTTITTSGSKAAGLVAQSIGGGGGTGGEALSGSIGAGFAASVAVGGSGGVAGGGGNVQSTVTGGLIAAGQNPLLVNGGNPGPGPCSSIPCNQLPVDDYGVVIQSIGGGGGLGGSATARAIAISVPVTPTGSQVALAAAAALGGSGGVAGAGGTAQFALSNGGKITTSGEGSTAALVQSIGGGGGAGGDSSALAAAIGYGQTVPEDASSLSVTPTFTVGGAGGGGGNGGLVEVAIGGTISNQSQPDPSGSAPTAITSYGDFADGIKAQSIGGGGGDAGFGSGTTQFFGSGNNTTVSVNLGSNGGSGGNGGPVQVDLYPGAGITTYGSGAVAIVAQSIGGGGGASQGGSINVGQTFNVGSSTLRPGLNLGLGEQGGSGGTGGTVSVTAEAPIATHGGDATGILAQSIGGGGGLGGSAGSDASADNPIVAAFAGREGVSNIKDYLQKEQEEKGGGVPFDATFALSIGGNGGSGGDGGDVSINLSAPVTTTGDWAEGVVAQSIGGGGGKGGSAAASGTGGLPEVTVNADVAVGGTGGVGGNGGSVTVNLNQGNTVIGTDGFGAAAIVAQSVGGGGGIGADGSDSATGLFSVGGSSGGHGGSGGDGGPVSVKYWNPSTSLISTSGAAADGVDAQSIGGGGGIAGAGSSLFEGAWKQSGSLTLSAGGGVGASGAGSTVTFEPQGGYDTPIAIFTTGNDSYGILAQSIGGGGGIVTSQPSGSSVNFTIGGQWNSGANSGGNGGAVSVTLLSQSTIATTGIGAHGIVAQSIGGGGGVIRIVNSAGDTPALTTAVPPQYGSNYSTISASGAGGAVTIEDDGRVSVTGAGSIGILAQSIGGGGGLISAGGLIYAGSPNRSGTGFANYAGGPVSVTTSGPISATGANGIGIFAQSTGLTRAPNGPVSITVNSSVIGGSGPGATYTSVGSSAVVIDSPPLSQAGQVTVNSGGSLETLSGTNGTAILASGGGYANVTNDGTVTGSVYMNGGTMSNGATYNSGVLVGGNLANSGTVNLGIPGTRPLQTTTVTGDFTQSATGRLVATIDSINKANSLLQVGGTASVSGLIVPSAITLLPGSYPVVTAGDLNTSASGQSSLLFNWRTAQSGNALTLSPVSNLTPAGASLTRSESSLGRYLTRAWNSSDAFFASQFASLSRINDAGQYRQLLDAHSGKATEAQSMALASSAGTILGAALSCPVFVNDKTMLGEDSCVWVRLTGQQTNQWTTNDTLGYKVASASYRLGGQHEFLPDWFVGGSLAVGQSWAKSDDGSTGYGQSLDGSVALKHTMGPWTFAGAIALATGTFHSSRLINLPGVSALLQSDPSAFLAGGRLRGSYEFAFNDWYIRPYADFDVIYTNLPGFQESGPAGFALDVHDSSHTSFAVSPMVEIGGRYDIGDKTTLRPFVAVGASFLSNASRAFDASFVGASGADGTFQSFVKTPSFMANAKLGVQLYHAGHFEAEAEYDVRAGNSFLSQGGGLRLAYHF